MTDRDRPTALSRRHLLLAGFAVPATAWLTSCATGGRRRPTPIDGATHEATEGPYYRLFSPANAVLRQPGMPGTPLVLTGRVLTCKGKPLANTLVDFWHADDGGVYDLKGYTLRGHQFTDAAGNYRLETVMPGLYPGRTRHIHVKLQPAGELLPKDPPQLTMTTQLYFPGEARNQDDDLYDAALLLAIDRDGDGRRAKFDFVIPLD
jgi:protocatechuate 3,4-dioxygenase beta subunit